MTTIAQLDVVLKGKNTELAKVVRDSVVSLERLRAKADQLDSALKDQGLTATLTAAQMDKLRAEYDATQSSIEKATHGTDKFREVTDKLDDRLGKTQTAISGITSALGGQGAVISDVVGGLSDFAMNLATGGPIMAAVATLGAGVAYVVTSIQNEVKAAAAAADVQIAKLEAARDAAIEISDELEAARTGKSVESIKAARAEVTARFDVDAAKNALADGIKKLGTSVPAELSGIALELKVTTDMSDIRRLYQEAATLIAGLDRTGANSSAVSLLPIVGMTTEALGVDSKSRLEPLSERLGTALATSSNVDIKKKNQAEKEKFDEEMKTLDEAVETANALEKAFQESRKAAQVLEDKMPAIVKDISEPYAFEVSMQDGSYLPKEGSGVASSQFLQNLADEGTQTIIDHTESVDPNVWLASMGLDEFGEAVKSKANSIDEIDLRTPFEKISATLDDAKTMISKAFENLGNFVASQSGNVASAVMGQGGMDQVGSSVGSAIGGAFGPAGAAIGAVIGSIAGDLVDKLIKILEIATPALDGLAVAVAALTPIFLVLKELMGVVGDLFIMLAPLLLELATPIAAIVLVVVRLLQAFVPFLGIVIGAVTVIASFLGALTLGVEWLDDNFFKPLVKNVQWIYAAVVNFYNGIIDWIRTLPGFGEAGVKIEVELTAPTDPLRDSPKTMEDLYGIGDAIRDNTDATAENTDAFNQQLTNLPSGYKVNGAMFGAEAGISMPTQYAVYIDTVNTSANTRAMLNDFARMARGGQVNSNGASRRGIDDDRN